MENMNEVIQKLRELIESNPGVNMEQLDELAKEISELQRPVKQYSLASPVERRRVVVGENTDSDPRTICLSTR